MALSVRIQQPPLPRYAISAPTLFNYLDTPHATLRGPWAWPSLLGTPVLRTDEDEPYLRFTRTGTGAAVITINAAALDIPAGSFDFRIWTRAVQGTQIGCAIGFRLGTSQAAGDQHLGATFSAAPGAWVERVATLTVTARTDWTFVLKLGDGPAGSVVDVKLGSIMPTGQAPIFGDTLEPLDSTDYYYWEGASNGSKSIKAQRTLTNVPGPVYDVDNVTTYSITENATPLSPVDTSGGATTVSFGIQEFDGSLLLAGGEATLLEDGRAIVQGRLDTPSSDGNTLSITSMSIISRLNVIRQVEPFAGSLDGYIQLLLASVGVDRPITSDIGIAERPIVAHGFKDNVLTRVKEFCSSQGVELSDKGDAVFLRQPRTRTVDVASLGQLSTSSDASQLAQSIQLVNYNSRYLENALIYPAAEYDDTSGTMTAAGWTFAAPILVVDSGSVATYEVPIIGSLVSVEQPVCVKEVGPFDGAAGSVYTVIGQGTVTDGAESIETLDPNEWTSRGGSVTVRVGDNYDTIVITITSGDNERLYAPFAIAMNAGAGTYYSSLRVRGTGVIDFKEKLTYETGSTDDNATTVVAATIDTPYVQSKEQADRVAAETVPIYSMLRVGLTGTFRNSQLEPGDIAGARFRHGDAVYRVTSAASSEGGVGFSAAADTTTDDFDEVWSAQTFDDFDAVWQHRTFEQFGAAPLATS